MTWMAEGEHMRLACCSRCLVANIQGKMFDAGLRARATLAAGLTLYDLLSHDRGRLDDPYQRLPGHSWLNSRDAAAREPILDAPKFEGAFLYYDAQMCEWVLGYGYGGQTPIGSPIPNPASRG